MVAIAVQGVTKRFSGNAHAAVDDCSLDIGAGELTVLLGPSGSGKTTLLKLINRLYDPDAGRILIDGADIRGAPAYLLRRRIGYVIQQVGLFPHLRVEQNIATVPQLLGWSRPRIDARIDELLDLVGLPRAYRRRFPRQLSGGEQQRVGLARALAADPAIMLMDEPFGALDAITRARLQDELRAIHRRLHKTILFVTHDVDEALRLADCVVVMRAGRVVQHGPPIEVLARPRDDFVRQLLAADDVLRLLSLLPAAGTARPARATGMGAPPDQASAPDPGGEPAVGPGATLRDALSALLRHRVEAVAVLDDAGRPVGRVGFEEIRRVLQDGRRRDA
ncbi:MAG: ABC transporter ATP-binding protein [Armatimonadota bacterium]|nr:ABC transporter ATP-binding protein [Armatimonadota bacterium]MDR7456772.1 ABC transporter ATP-binding protein [Armatimonadota bacterium]MDR7497016.1 ABC transporter ATP-binding protein [Armatimonadota bacterium]